MRRRHVRMLVAHTRVLARAHPHLSLNAIGLRHHCFGASMRSMEDTAPSNVGRFVCRSIFHHKLTDAVLPWVCRRNSALIPLAACGVDGRLSRELNGALAIAGTIQASVSARQR